MLRTIIAAALAAGLAMAPGVFGSAAAQQTQNSPAATKPADTKAKPAEPKAKRPLTEGQKAFQERQKKCAAEWKDAKAAGKVETGATWPKFLSACNKRLKG
jgi:hypothetical protein